MMITFFRCLEMLGVSTANLRLVRHGNKEIPVLATFREERNRFEVYQSFQDPKRFADAAQIAAFAPLPTNAALFLGLWDIVDVVPNIALTDAHRALIDDHEFPQEWKQYADFYVLKLNPGAAEIAERLVIDWGAGALSWVQKQDKPVIELRRPNSIGEFTSFSDVRLGFTELRQLIADEAANLAWHRALSSVNGIYLICDKSSGKLYVGSTYNEHGIINRWRLYARDGHAGNERLIPLDPRSFEFSILEIVSFTVPDQEIIALESKWKERLGTRKFGLNGN